MPDWADTPGEFLTILSIVAVVMSGVLWLIRAQVAQMKELRPNGGSSLRDAINRIEDRQMKIQDKIDNHIVWHLEDSND